MFSGETTVPKRNYKDFLFNIRNLPSIPMVIFEVSKLLDDPFTSASELAELINKDQGMVAKILTVANSPLYGLPRKVSTIEFAIVILGFENIKNIITALSMIETLKGKADKYWNRKRYWSHSLATASIAKKIADDVGYAKSGEAFTAGLLHDLGISIIQRFLNKEFVLISKQVTDNNISYLDAEQEVLEATHQEVGYFLAEKWNLPQPLADTILHHHYPSKCAEHKTLASIVHLGDYMTQKLHTGYFNWDDTIELDPSIIDILNLGDENYLDEFINSYKEIFQNQIETLIR
jgi:putative nucleotidyltransferase with HDIG domain